jgi:hypothetical protein
VHTNTTACRLMLHSDLDVVGSADTTIQLERERATCNVQPVLSVAQRVADMIVNSKPAPAANDCRR